MTSEICPACASLHALYLTIGLGDETAGLPLRRVEEVIGLARVAPVMQPPDYASGFVTLRGRTIPVADMRAAFGFKAAFTTRTRLVVVRLNAAGQKPGLLALVVDRVDDVATFTDDEIEPATTAAGTDSNADFLLGYARVGRRRRPLLDVDRLFIDAIAS